MAVAAVPALVPQLQPQPVPEVPRVAGRVADPGRLAHLGQGGGGQQPGPGRAAACPGGRLCPGQEGRPAGQVGDGRPQLARGPHRGRVVLGLGQQQVGVRVHGEAGSVRRLRPGGGPAHAERREQLNGDHVVPGPAAQPGQQLAEQRVTDVGVVEAPARPGSPRVRAERVPDQRLERRPRGPLPERPGGLGPQAGGVRQQLADGQLGRARGVEVPSDRVGQVEQALVAQPQHRDRDERLGDRACPVLHVRVGHRPGGAVGPAAPARPDQLPPAHQAGRHRRNPPARLFLRQPGGQQAPGVLVGHEGPRYPARRGRGPVGARPNPVHPRQAAHVR
jgi:hypothetical protein